MNRVLRSAFAVSALLALSAPVHAELPFPAQLAGKAVALSAADPDYARAVVSAAVKPDGQGGVTEALVVRITEDIPVYRMWNGPAKKDARGNTNRLGGWWSYDAPSGAVTGYRSNYEICQAWNDLTWVARCTLKAGAVVAVGPGQSVAPETCGDPTGKESYAVNTRDWQLYVDKPWLRSAELSCPAETADYEADPANIAQAKTR
ncbi:hypothetical protein [Derxia lacustris]|uniref:hypothetical protein n=1 Tax=Derxia lacustris TaxID=764842 RepID=UPI000A175224|nr:hypothetical protein [Derxia lacustris]